MCICGGWWFIMIDHYTIKLAPDDLAKLSKVKAKVEIVGDYADMEKVRDALRERQRDKAGTVVKEGYCTCTFRRYFGDGYLKADHPMK
jgi:hypothetical protein